MWIPVFAAFALAAEQRTELYFGTAVEGGPAVTEEQWSGFLETEVAPRFAGFTVLEADGGWTWNGVTVREHTHVLLLVDTKGDEAAIEAVRALWCERFKQQSVLRVDSKVKVDF